MTPTCSIILPTSNKLSTVYQIKSSNAYGRNNNKDNQHKNTDSRHPNPSKCANRIVGISQRHYALSN